VDVQEYVHQQTMGSGPDEPPAADEPPYEPSDEDLAEMASWSAGLDGGMDFPREMSQAERHRSAIDAVAGLLAAFGRGV
jgi:hypothetical protein